MKLLSWKLENEKLRNILSRNFVWISSLVKCDQLIYCNKVINLDRPITQQRRLLIIWCQESGVSKTDEGINFSPSWMVHKLNSPAENPTGLNSDDSPGGKNHLAMKPYNKNTRLTGKWWFTYWSLRYRVRGQGGSVFSNQAFLDRSRPTSQQTS